MMGYGSGMMGYADPSSGERVRDLERDGRIVGMLSVHAESGAVRCHGWHGRFVEMSG